MFWIVKSTHVISGSEWIPSFDGSYKWTTCYSNIMIHMFRIAFWNHASLLGFVTTSDFGVLPLLRYMKLFWMSYQKVRTKTNSQKSQNQPLFNWHSYVTDGPHLPNSTTPVVNFTPLPIIIPHRRHHLRNPEHPSSTPGRLQAPRAPSPATANETERKISQKFTRSSPGDSHRPPHLLLLAQDSSFRFFFLIFWIKLILASITSWAGSWFPSVVGGFFGKSAFCFYLCFYMF